MIVVREGMTRLDLGSGTGSLTARLMEAGLEVTGMDGSADQFERTRRDHPDIEFIRGDACDFILARSVGVVFSNAVFHWIERDGQPDMLACIC